MSQPTIYDALLGIVTAQMSKAGLTTKDVAEQTGVHHNYIEQLVRDKVFNGTLSDMVKVCLFCGYGPKIEFVNNEEE